MLQQEEITSIITAYQNASSYLIILRPSPTFDQVASAVALTFALQDQKKIVQIACSEPLGNQFQQIVGVERVQQSLGNRSLEVTFDYSEEMVENVSYNVDQANKKFHLVIRPKKGFRTIDPDTVEYSHVGIDADVIFLFGVGSFADIQDFYSQDEQAFHQANTIAINKTPTNFANTNIDVNGHSCVSEMMTKLLTSLELPVSSDAATNLLSGLETTTDSFKHYSVTADTFETVAQLMRHGAKRLRVQSTTATNGFSKNPLAEAFAKAQPKPQSKPAMQLPSQYSPPAK